MINRGIKRHAIWQLLRIVFLLYIILNLTNICVCAGEEELGGSSEIYNYFVSSAANGEVAECVIKDEYQVIFDGRASSNNAVSIDIPVISKNQFTVAIEVLSGTVSGSSGPEFTRFAEDPRLIIDGVISKEWSKISDEKWVYTVPVGTDSLKLGFYVNQGYLFKKHAIAVTITDSSLIDNYYEEYFPEKYNHFVSEVDDGKVAECVIKYGYQVMLDGRASVNQSSRISLPIINENGFTVAIEVISGSAKGSSGTEFTKIVENPCLVVDGVVSRDWNKLSDKKWTHTVPAGTKVLSLGFYVNTGYTFYEHTIAVTVTDAELIDNYYEEYFVPAATDTEDDNITEREDIYNWFVSGAEDGQLMEVAAKDGHKLVFDGQASSNQSFYLSVPVPTKEEFTVAVEVLSGTSKGSASSYETKITETPCLVIDGVVNRDWNKVSDEKWILTVPAGTSSLQLGFYVNKVYTFYQHTLAVTITKYDLIENYYGEYLADAPEEQEKDYTVTENYNHFVSSAEDGEISECVVKDGYKIIIDGTPSANKTVNIPLPILGDQEFTVAIEVLSGSITAASGREFTKFLENPRLIIDKVSVYECTQVSDEKYIYTVPAGTKSLSLGLFICSSYIYHSHTIAVTVTDLPLKDSVYEEFVINEEATRAAEHIAAEIEDAELNGRKVCFLSNEGEDWNDGKTPDSPKKTLSQYIGRSDITLLLRNGDTFFIDRSFTPGENVRITSYGDSYCGEEKPLISGLHETEPLKYDADSGLYTVEIPDSNIGFLIIDGIVNWKRVTIGEGKIGTITNDGEWDIVDGMLKIKSSVSLTGKRLSYAANLTGVRAAYSNNSIDDIEIAYCGSGGITSATDVNNFTVTNCYVHHVGGSIGGGDYVRYGNGIQVWLSACNNHLISNNRVAYCFDAGITAQVTNTISRDSSYSCENIVFENNTVENCMYLIETFQSNTGGMHCNVEYNNNYLRNCCDFVGAAYRKNTAFMAQICTWRIVNQDDIVAYRNNICIGSEQYSISMMKEQYLGTYIWDNNVFISDQEQKINYPDLYTGMDTFITIASDAAEDKEEMVKYYELVGVQGESEKAQS